MPYVLKFALKPKLAIQFLDSNSSELDRNSKIPWSRLLVLNKRGKNCYRIECVRSGHVGGVNNEKYLHENEMYFPKEHRFIVLLLQHGRCEHTLYHRP